jgi:hypothetical protein
MPELGQSPTSAAMAHKVREGPQADMPVSSIGPYLVVREKLSESA